MDNRGVERVEVKSRFWLVVPHHCDTRRTTRHIWQHRGDAGSLAKRPEYCQIYFHQRHIDMLGELFDELIEIGDSQHAGLHRTSPPKGSLMLRSA